MYKIFFKRIFDILVALISLIVLLPLLFLVAILIKLTSRGDIFFKQERIGKDQKIFRIIKFRTMYDGAISQQRLNVEAINDLRVTRLGKILRRLKIDELPQLINIIFGEMSIVGPRPTLPDYLLEYEEWERNRFKTKPGLTGLAQVNGNIYLTRVQKSHFDIEYVNNVSFLLDLKIIFKTVLIIIMGEKKFINSGEKK